MQKEPPSRSALPQYFQDRLIPPVDESTLSTEERADRKKWKKQAKEMKAEIRELLQLRKIAKATPLSKGERIKQRAIPKTHGHARV